MADVTVEIGGLRTAFVTHTPEVIDVVAHRYAGFLSSDLADWRIETSVRPEGLVDLEDVVVRPTGDAGRFAIERHDFVAVLDVAARTGTLALLEAGALLVHAASLGRGGRSWMFPGRSGSGKTTLTRLSPDATLLSDEISIVRLGAVDGARCYGSPFWGELGEAGRNTAVPLTAVHFLRHADRHATTPLTPRRALEALLPNVLFFAAEPALVARVLEVAAALVERVPCFALGFRPEASVWEAIHAA